MQNNKLITTTTLQRYNNGLIYSAPGFEFFLVFNKKFPNMQFIFFIFLVEYVIILK